MVARLYLAWATYLNPDEAMIIIFSHQSSLAANYQASLLSAHPPLFYLVLYYWRLLGSSELALRLPSVIAGTLFCWAGYKWLGKIADESTARLGLMFFCFTPALAGLSAQIRQYALLLLFLALALYCLETALQENSAGKMLLFSFSLWLAILTHYSAALFCLAVGVYGLLRVVRARLSGGVGLAWAAGQVVALGIYAVLYRTQIPVLRKFGEAQGFLRSQGFGSVLRENFRLFHYLFRQPVVGALVLLLFVIGVARLVRTPQTAARDVGWLLLLPFPISWMAALGRVYPFDGSRHDVFLALFVAAGASLGLDWLRAPAGGKKFLLLGALLVSCYLFAQPLGAHISLRSQRQPLMAQAVDYVRRSAPPGSVVLVDYQSTYLFRYYFCRDQVVPPRQASWAFRSYGCGGYKVAASSQWMFTPEDLRAEVGRAAQVYGLGPGASAWLFQAGWDVDRQPALRAALPELGCSSPRGFGENIVVCRVTIPEPATLNP